MRSEGHPESDIEQALALVRKLHQAAGESASYETVDALLQQVRDEPWYGYLTLDSAEDWHLIRPDGCRALRTKTSARPDSLPVLAIYGGLDLLVPAWQSAEECGRAVQQAGNTDATVIVFPHGDHRIQDPATGDFATGYLDLLGDWTARRLVG